jgi:hypothetical protein
MLLDESGENLATVGEHNDKVRTNVARHDPVRMNIHFGANRRMPLPRHGN